MGKQSAGILVYRWGNRGVEILLAHHGGPFWAKKDNGAWSIIKGEYDDNENPFDAAKREFKEETGHDAPEGEYLNLGDYKRKDGKTIHAWAVEADFDAKSIKSNNFEMEWPPKSGNIQKFPENDRAEWFLISQARLKMHSGQDIFLDRLVKKLGVTPEPPKTSQDQGKQGQLF